VKIVLLSMRKNPHRLKPTREKEMPKGFASHRKHTAVRRVKNGPNFAAADCR